MNLKRLIKTCKRYQNVEIIPKGLWSERSTLHFNMIGDEISSVSQNGMQTVQVDAIDNVCASERVTFIKMDIEGSELEALHGAEHIIRRDKPRLAICIYHKPEDYFRIPLLIKEIVPEYKLYIRHHDHSTADTVCYAVVNKGEA